MGKLTFTLLLISILSFNACKHSIKTKVNQDKIPLDTIVKLENDSHNTTIESIFKYDKDLTDVLNRAVKVYPDDSASIIDFYSGISSKDPRENQKQIKKIEGLISNSIVERCHLVHKNLKPLMISIVNSDTVNILQASEFVKLYSDYDHFRGESLFDNLLTNDENYSLVWESLRKIAHSSSQDTTYISSLIELNQNVRTNVELAEAMQDFVIESIKSNPKGFLDMFIKRSKAARKSFSDNISYFEDPDTALIRIYKEFSTNSDIKYQNPAKELLNYQTTINKN
jgi:hypothetical protein